MQGDYHVGFRVDEITTLSSDSLSLASQSRAYYTYHLPAVVSAPTFCTDLMAVFREVLSALCNIPKFCKIGLG